MLTEALREGQTDSVGGYPSSFSNLQALDLDSQMNPARDHRPPEHANPTDLTKGVDPP